MVLFIPSGIGKPKVCQYDTFSTYRQAWCLPYHKYQFAMSTADDQSPLFATYVVACTNLTALCVHLQKKIWYSKPSIKLHCERPLVDCIYVYRNLAQWPKTYNWLVLFFCAGNQRHSEVLSTTICSFC